MEKNFFISSKVESVTFSNQIEEIPSRTFERCYSLNTIIFPANLKVIGYRAFDYCENLTVVELPEVDLIDSYCFVDCKNLQKVTCKGKNLTIKNKAFYYSSIEVFQTYGTFLVDEEAFSDCLKLVEFSSPQKLDYINKRAFQYCKSLEKIDPSPLDAAYGIEAEAFSNCRKLNIESCGASPALYIDSSAFYSCTSSITSI